MKSFDTRSLIGANTPPEIQIGAKLESDDAKSTVDDSAKALPAAAASESTDIDEIENRIGVFVDGLLEASPRYHRAEQVIERMVEAWLMSEVTALEKIASKLSIDLAFVPHLLEENRDEN